MPSQVTTRLRCRSLKQIDLRPATRRADHGKPNCCAKKRKSFAPEPVEGCRSRIALKSAVESPAVKMQRPWNCARRPASADLWRQHEKADEAHAYCWSQSAVGSRKVQAPRIKARARGSKESELIVVTWRLRMTPVTEWVNITRDVSIIAHESGEVWFHTPSTTKQEHDPSRPR